MDQAKIIDELNHSPLFQGPISLEPMTGGTVNRSFKLVSNGKAFFLKTFELNHIVPTDRQALFIQQQQLAKYHKAAIPVYLSHNHDFQVEQWVDHISLCHASLSWEEKLKYLANSLFQIHQLPAIAMSIDLPKDWLMYLDSAALPDNEYWYQRIDDCKQDWIDTHKTHQVLCHNDLAFEHISFGEPPVVFDWEYAALGNRFFDIAACALINQLDESATLALQRHYAELAGVSSQFVFESCQQQFPIVSLTNDLWYLAAKTVKSAL